MSRWRGHDSAGIVLRTAWLFLGAAIGLAAIILAVSLAAVLDPYVPGDDWTLYPVCLAPFLFLGLLPGVRDLEVTAARAMLGVEAELVVPRHPTAAHRWRSATWAVLHLVLGLATAVALVGLLPGALWIAAAGVRSEAVDVGSVAIPAATSALGTVAAGGRWAGRGGRPAGCWPGCWDGWRPAAAPAFLGPTAADRLALAEARLAAEAEHTRLARDLHDGIGHALTIIAVQTAAGRRVLDDDPATAARALAAAEEVARDALEELDSVLAALRDPGERPGPEPGVDRLPALLAAHREAGLAVVAEIDDLPALPPVVSGTVYRVVAEGLANAQRYAGAGDIILRVQGEPDAVRVLVDNPRPADRDSGGARAAAVWSAYASGWRCSAAPSRPGRRTAAGGCGSPSRSVGPRPGERAVSDIRVLVVDDEPLVREGLRLIIAAEPGLTVVGEAGDGAEAVSLARRLRPDVVCLDVRMPGIDGIRATELLVATEPAPKVLVVTTFSADDYVYGALEAGASGFLLKRATADELVAAIRAVASGDSLLFPASVRQLALRRRRRDRYAGEPLTPREVEVLTGMADGLTNAEIAARLVVGVETVRTHVAGVLRKLGARDRTQAVVTAYGSGLLHLP